MDYFKMKYWKYGTLWHQKNGCSHKKFHKYYFFYLNISNSNKMHFLYSTFTVGHIKLPLQKEYWHNYRYTISILQHVRFCFFCVGFCCCCFVIKGYMEDYALETQDEHLILKMFIFHFSNQGIKTPLSISHH